MNAKKLLALFIIAISISSSAQVKNYTPINYGPKNYGMAYDAENHAIAQNARHQHLATQYLLVLKTSLATL